GPYIELMCGAYTDNQPDFSWLMPGEEKRFTQSVLPFKLIGGAKNATAEAVLNLEVRGGEAEVGVYVTRPRTVTVRLLRGGAAVYEETAELSPETALVRRVALEGAARPDELALGVW